MEKITQTFVEHKFPNMTYSEKLKNPKWQKLRLRIFERDEWTCQSCGSKDNNLQVHHLKYFTGLEPWEYEPHYLVTYCETCHNTEHHRDQISESLIELIKLDKIYIRQISQLTVLVEEYPAFYDTFRQFLNNCYIEYLKSKTLKAA